MTELTPKQEAILFFILNTIRDKFYQPSVREIADEFGFKSTNAAVAHLKFIAKKGYLVVGRNQSRALGITKSCQFEYYEELFQ